MEQHGGRRATNPVSRSPDNTSRKETYSYHCAIHPHMTATVIVK
jgi:plastocyanin